MPAVRALAAASPVSSASAARAISQLLCRGAVHGQLGGALDQVDHSVGQLPARCRLPRLRARGQRAGQPWHERSGDQQCAEQDQARGGQHPPLEHDGRRPDDQRDRERGHDPDEQVLQRVDIADQACQQIATAEGGQAQRCQELEAFVHAHPRVRQHAQRRVVADDPLAVAAQPAREREELHADDRDRHGRLLRALRGARDQPGRGRDQADRGGHRARAEQRRERQPPGGRSRDRERS